jgi:transcriptional regulator NrdR family protein
MKCPHCGSGDKHMVEKTVLDGPNRRRTRRCYTCGKTFKTLETVDYDSSITPPNSASEDSTE